MTITHSSRYRFTWKGRCLSIFILICFLFEGIAVPVVSAQPSSPTSFNLAAPMDPKQTLRSYGVDVDSPLIISFHDLVSEDMDKVDAAGARILEILGDEDYKVVSKVLSPISSQIVRNAKDGKAGFLQIRRSRRHYYMNLVFRTIDLLKSVKAGIEAGYSKGAQIRQFIERENGARRLLEILWQVGGDYLQEHISEYFEQTQEFDESFFHAFLVALEVAGDKRFMANLLGVVFNEGEDEYTPEERKLAIQATAGTLVREYQRGRYTRDDVEAHREWMWERLEAEDDVTVQKEMVSFFKSSLIPSGVPYLEKVVTSDLDDELKKEVLKEHQKLVLDDGFPSETIINALIDLVMNRSIPIPFRIQGIQILKTILKDRFSKGLSNPIQLEPILGEVGELFFHEKNSDFQEALFGFISIFETELAIAILADILDGSEVYHEEGFSDSFKRRVFLRVLKMLQGRKLSRSANKTGLNILYKSLSFSLVNLELSQKIQVVEVFATHGYHEGIDEMAFLLTSLKNTNDRRKVRTAIIAVSEYDNLGVTEFLIRYQARLTGSRYGASRQLIEKVLKGIDPEGIKERKILQKKKESPEKKIQAANYLKERKDIRAVAELNKTAHHEQEEDAKVRLASMEALHAILSPDSLETLIAGTKDPEEPIRIVAIQALGDLYGYDVFPEVISVLKEIAKEKGEERIQIEALRSLQKIAEKIAAGRNAFTRETLPEVLQDESTLDAYFVARLRDESVERVRIAAQALGKGGATMVAPLNLLKFISKESPYAWRVEFEDLDEVVIEALLDQLGTNGKTDFGRTKVREWINARLRLTNNMPERKMTSSERKELREKLLRALLIRLAREDNQVIASILQEHLPGIVLSRNGSSPEKGANAVGNILKGPLGQNGRSFAPEFIQLVRKSAARIIQIQEHYSEVPKLVEVAFFTESEDTVVRQAAEVALLSLVERDREGVIEILEGEYSRWEGDPAESRFVELVKINRTPKTGLIVAAKNPRKVIDLISTRKLTLLSA